MRILPALAAALLLLPGAAAAALKAGAQAPEFRTQGALAGKLYRVSLSRQLRKGPVVLYFFPAAFTRGCTLEAHEFAEASAEFRTLGATVIGMSADPVDKLRRFSVEACRDKFAVASASPAVIAAYDVRLDGNPAMSSRTSYLIAPDGRIVRAFSDPNHRDHVKTMLAALREWRAARESGTGR